MANYTILLIDYEPRSIERFREPLITAGYAIEIATDGVSGIEAFHRLNPDMVLVEAMIPKKHGFEVCQELKRTPHGRRTPVLITTGVYKGRKYRTQALHIYGCDEYIEKPIAPEQLLKIVGKFFGSAASAPASKAAESASSSPEPGTDPRVLVERASLPASIPSSERLTSGPKHKVEEDRAEDEITARLDAILPGGGNATQLFTGHEPVVAVAAVPETGEDPFAQMRAELDAELGSLSAALAFEPTLAPSDQALSPSVLEALPTPEVEFPSVPSVAPAPPPPIVAGGQVPTGQVVDFVANRSRKNKKPERQSSAQPPKAARVAPPPKPVELTLPPGTLVAAQLDPTPRRSGMPAWIWAALGVVAIATAYFVFARSGSRDGDAATPLPKPAKSVAIAQAETNAPPQANTSPPANSPLAAATAAPEPAPRVPESSKPVQSALGAPAPKKGTDRTSKAPVAEVPAPRPPLAPPAAVAAAKPERRKIDAKPSPAKETSPAATAPAGLDDAVAGVETVSDVAAPPPAARTTPGALIPIDTADTLPVALSHQAPAFSLQARQLRLSGKVVMNVLVNERGTVDQVVLVSGVSGAGVNDAAMRAAESWTYRPATKDGVPVKVWKSEQIDLKL
jgi:TonB family protein